jgi:hypothetical protein
MAAGWHSLLEVARHAPSPYNAQPWQLRILDDATAEVYIDRSRTLPEEELSGTYLVLSMGLLVESLRLVAANRGLRLEDELTAANSTFQAEELDQQSEDHVLFARLTLGPGERPSEYPDELFLARRTSRLPFEPRPVELADARALAQLAASWGYRYTQTSSAERIERLLATSIQAAHEWLKQPGCRREIERWIRFTDRQARTRGDGVGARSLVRQPFDLLAEYRLPEPIRSLTGGDFAERTRRQIGPVATMGILSGACRLTREAYRAGEFLMHFWLECTRRGLYLQPFANLVNDAAAARRCEQDWRVRDIWLEFRIGRSAEPAKSYRRAVEDLWLEDAEAKAEAPPISRASSDRRS